MLSNRLSAVAIIGALIASSACAEVADKALDQQFKTVLDARMASVTPPDVSSDPGKVNHLFESIDVLAQRGKEADGVLAKLFDYYLGEGPGEDLATFVIKRGHRMVPVLTERKRQPLNCLPAYQSICRDNVQNRNAVIDAVIGEIKNSDK
jgi:hypothetical protein